MRITVCGGGNAAHALSGYLALNGHAVTLYETPEFISCIEYLNHNGMKISFADAIVGEALLERVTSKADEAIPDAQFIFVTVPSFGQESIFDYISPYIEKAQVIFIMPGNFGSISLYHRLKKRGVVDDIIIGESDTIPFATRLDADKKCHVFGVKKKFYCAAVPSSKTTQLINRMRSVLPMDLAPLPSAIAAGLNNNNMVVHCAAMVLNAGRIEAGERFRFYCDGMTPAVCKLIEKVDEEKLAVCNRLGYGEMQGEFDMAVMLYSLNREIYSSIYDIFSRHPVYSKMGPDSPCSVSHRYLTEDVPYLLVPTAELGKIVGVCTTTIDSIIHIAGVINGVDFMNTGRGLRSLGFCDLSIEAIMDEVN